WYLAPPCSISNSAALAEIASARAALLLIEHGGAKYHGTSSKGTLPKAKFATINPSDISQLIGTDYSSAEVAKALVAIGCKVTKSGKRWRITSPSWRGDLNHVSDFAEEVARFYGYERIPSRIPTPKIPKSGKTGLTPLQQRRRYLSLALANKGFTEVHNYPFVNQSQMDLFGFTGERAKTFKIANPISDQNPLLRTHLSIGLLETAARNLSRGAKSAALFESGLVFRDVKKLEKATGISTAQRPTANQIKKIYESVPFQSLHIGGVVAGEIELSGWWGKGRTASWEDAVAITGELLGEITSDFSVKNVELAPWHPGRCAEFTVAGQPVAHAGEIHPRICASLGLPDRTIFFALLVDAIPVQKAIQAQP
ncbi:MAG: phenylalanine--tRNA ligase subunit beta, partial [Actinobacteria bacterium]|nr:phenylalanine--tRNA ligase subunit beta [Actinomycetota bacterium]